METSPEFVEFLKSCSAMYFEAMELVRNNNSKESSVTAPYQFHYKSRELLFKFLERLSNFKESNISSSTIDCQRLLAILHLKIGINFIETEETSSGKDHLEKCKSIIDCCDHDSEKNTGIKQELLNQLGLFHTQKGDIEKGLQYLMEAKILYENFLKEAFCSPLSIDNFFRVEAYNAELSMEIVNANIEKFEDNYTHTLYYLAQVYGKMDLNNQSAEYCKETLKRQLARNKYVPLDWSMNAATLSQFYISQNDFLMGRHCLVSAEVILKEFGEKPADLSVEISKDESQEDADCKEKVPKAWADLYRCWVKYAISLLEYSKERLFENLENDHHSPKDNTDSQLDKEFFNLNLTLGESKITDKPVLVFDEARHVFLQAQTWINSAKEFYVLDGHCSDYIELIKDHSSLFKILAFFELDLNRQCKMHKRRIDMLSEVLHKLNSQYYLAICCQLSFEIGEVYSTMLDNKLALLEMDTDPGWEQKCQAVKKVNALALKGIEYFQKYLQYLSGSDGKLPHKFQDDDERPALIAHFYCGRLFSKLNTGDYLKQLENTRNSFKHYSYLVDYCKTNPSAVDKVREERNACEEMVKLLPAKMDKIKSQIDQ